MKTRGLKALVGDERGVALVLALMVLLTLTGLALAFLSASAFEPQISRNQSDSARARYVAEAGIEYAYNVLATDVANGTNWNTRLVGATCSQGAVLGTANATLPGLSSTSGTFTVRIRNDCQSGDNKMTGVAVESGGNATNETNNRVIVTSTASFRNGTRTITTVIKRAPFVFNGALSFPGVQADVDFDGSAFNIDGRDTRMTDSCGRPTGSGAAQLGIAVNGSLSQLESQVESALAHNEQNSVTGADESGSGIATGDSTIDTDSTQTSDAITELAHSLKQYADVSIETSPGNTYSISNFGTTCDSSWSSSTCWGTLAKPKIVYVNGTLPSANSQYTSLNVSGNSVGTGILIVENGNVEITGNFRWNGPIIVTGNNVGVRYWGGGNQMVYGSVVVNEQHDDGSTSVEGEINGNTCLAYSRGALNLVQSLLSRRLVSAYSWTDL